MSSKSDAELVSMAQQGDREAFGELYRRHYEAVLRVARWRLGRDAEEIAQAAFARALERIDQCGGEQRFGAWVQTIAWRLGVDHTRREHRVAARMTAVASTVPVWAPARDTPEEHTLRRERAEILAAVLAGLPRRQRQVLVARAVEDRSPREIAAVLGLSVAAIDSLLFRARRAAAAGYRAVAAGETAAGGAGFPTFTVAAAAGASTVGPSLWRKVTGGLSSGGQRLAGGSSGLLTGGRPRLSEWLAGAGTVLAIGAGILPGAADVPGFDGERPAAVAAPARGGPAGAGVATDALPSVEAPRPLVAVPERPSAPAAPSVDTPSVPAAPAPPEAPVRPPTPDPSIPDLLPAPIAGEVGAAVAGALEPLLGINLRPAGEALDSLLAEPLGPDRQILPVTAREMSWFKR